MENKENAKLIYEAYIDTVVDENGKKIFKGNRSKPLVDEGSRLTVLNTAFNHKIPGVLIELGFITHPEDRKNLFDENIQSLMVEGLYKGIKSAVES